MQNKIIEIEKSGDDKKSRELLLGEMKYLQNEYFANIKEMVDFQIKRTIEASALAEEAFLHSRLEQIITSIAIIIICILFAIMITRSIVKPVKLAVNAANSIAKGNTKIELKYAGKDEIATLIYSMQLMADNISAMVGEISRVSLDARNGKLDSRANEKQFEGEYSQLMSEFNGTLNAVISPLNVTAEYVDRISKGDIPPLIIDTYLGDFNEIKNNLNQCVRTMNLMLTTTSRLTDDARNGKLDRRANHGEFTGSWAELVRGINSLIDALVYPINITAEYVDRISKGDIPPRIVEEYKGDFNEIKNNLNQCIDAISGLVKDTLHLSENAMYARLRVRADSSVHGGDFKKIVDGINNSLDSIVGFVDKLPLPIMAIDRDYNIVYINEHGSKLSDKLTGFVEGKKCYDHFKTDACNTQECGCAQSIMSKENVNSSTVSHVGGKQLDFNYTAIPIIDNRGTVQGAFEIVIDQTEINKTLNHARIVSDYQDYEVEKLVNSLDMLSMGNLEFSYKPEGPSEDTQLAYNAFNKIGDALGKSIDSIKQLANDTKVLTIAAVEGKLDTRTDVNKHKGEFKLIVEGFNNTLNNVIGPLNVAAEYVDRISKGDIPVQISDHYNGDFNEIKNNINQLILNLNNFTGEMTYMAQMHEEGDIDIYMDESKFEGAYHKMVFGINAMVKSHIDTKRKAMEVFEHYANGNFNASLERLKGKKVFINNTIDSVRNNLLLIVDEIKNLIENIKDGKLGKRIESSQFTGDWKKMVNGLNEIVESFVQPLNEAGDVLSTMSTGDLTVRMNGNYKGDLDKLKQDINQLGDSLSSLIKQVSESVHNAASSAFEISSTAESLAVATQEQSSQADDVVAAVEEMTQTIADNAKSANRTSDVAKYNGTVAEEGGNIVEQTVGKMRDIANVVKNSANNIQKLGESSQQIGEIILVIDEIADQTNLLALNAAIEAARAGEQGRGFAVVADEVRKLAERTTEATKRIASMIKSIQADTEQAVDVMNIGTKEVQGGIELADKAGSSLKAIMNSTNEVLEMVNLIAAATEEQSATSEQIAKNVGFISKVTAESSKRVEDVAHSAENLAELTSSLTELMNNFKFAGNGNSYNDNGYKLIQRKEKLRLPNGSLSHFENT